MTALREFFLLANRRPDGSPALSFKIESAVLLLDLGARGGVFRVTGPHRDGTPDGNGGPTKAYFAPLDPTVWNRGQACRMVTDSIMRFLESSGGSKPTAKKTKA